MKLIKQFLLVAILSTIIYTFVLQLSLVNFIIAECFTLGFFLFILSFVEAFTLKKCEKEYSEYIKRQEKIISESCDSL